MSDLGVGKVYAAGDVKAEKELLAKVWMSKTRVPRIAKMKKVNVKIETVQKRSIESSLFRDCSKQPVVGVPSIGTQLHAFHAWNQSLAEHCTFRLSGVAC